MVALLILVVGGLVAVGLWSWLASHAGRHGAPASPGGRTRPAEDRLRDPLGRRSAQAILERREALEAEDLDQMLAAHNAWRRRRGRPERTIEDVESLVAAEMRTTWRARD